MSLREQLIAAGVIQPGAPITRTTATTEPVFRIDAAGRAIAEQTLAKWRERGSPVVEIDDESWRYRVRASQGDRHADAD